MTEANHVSWTTLYPKWMWGVIAVFLLLEVVFLCFGYDALKYTAWHFGGDAIAYAGWGALGAVVCIVYRLGRLRLVPPGLRPKRFSLYLLLMGILFFVCLCIPPAVNKWTPSRTYRCRSRLRMIHDEFLEYQQAHGTFPPLFNTSSKGNRLESWRTLTMRDPRWYRCPMARPSKETCYVAVYGEDAFWKPDGTPRAISDLRNAEATAILVEFVDSGIAWNRPGDVRVEDLVSGRTPWSQTNAHPFARSAFYRKGPRTVVLFANGDAASVFGTPSADEIRQLFSIHSEHRPDHLLKISGDRPNPLRMAALRVWQTCLVLIAVSVFLPDQRRV